MWSASGLVLNARLRSAPSTFQRTTHGLDAFGRLLLSWMSQIRMS